MRTLITQFPKEFDFDKHSIISHIRVNETPQLRHSQTECDT